MRAFQGYIENGRVIPVDMPQVQDGLRVVITVSDSAQTTFERGAQRVKDDFTRDNSDIRSSADYVSSIDTAGEERFINPRSKAGALTSSDFTALKLDTRNFKFDREEVHER
ncbi:MAG: hypothetical protein LBL73_01150 [Synergistaceae bacterium]|jgi:hypothetical protein|nr:hypothetical protein [Synergistaceae bacterium]